MNTILGLQNGGAPEQYTTQTAFKRGLWNSRRIYNNAVYATLPMKYEALTKEDDQFYQQNHGQLDREVFRRYPDLIAQSSNEPKRTMLAMRDPSIHDPTSDWMMKKRTRPYVDHSAKVE
jgi:hypothetical protein